MTEKSKTISRLFIFAICAFFLYTSCSNPLSQIGLGDKVDLEVPELSVTSNANGDYVMGVVTLSGRFADDIDVESIRVSFDGGINFSPATLDKDAKTWSISVDTQTYVDGEHEIVILITDTAGKVIEKRLFLFFDNKPPVVLVKVPQGYELNEYNGEFSIKGEAADQFGISQVTVEVLNSGGATILPEQVAVGTSSWSFQFDSKSVLPAGSAGFRFLVRAYDNSSNTNTYLYHNDDVYAAAGNETVTVEQLNTIDQGATVSGVSLTQADLIPLRMTDVPLTVNQNLDLPEFIISNPDESAPADQNILSNNAKAIGLVLDDDGIDPSSIEVSFNDGASWTAVDQTFGSGLSVRWQHELTALGGGSHTIKIRAVDIYGIQNESVNVSFSIDLGAPAVEVTVPDQGSYQHGTFLIRGTAFDSEGIASIGVSTNGGVDYYPATNTGSGFSTWEYSAAVPGDGLTDGNRTIKIMAEDTSGKTGFVNLQVIVDTQAPTVSFLTPANSSTVNGEVLIRGTASDNTQITKVELKVGKSDPWIALAGMYNWDYTIDSVSYANATHSIDMGGGVWKLNVQARATDAAGNLTTVSNYYLFIDNDLDKPTVNIVSPANGANVGGSVLITGTAFDDDAVHHVEMQIDLNDDGDFLDTFDLNGNGHTNDPATDPLEKEGTWYTVTGTTLWTQELNTAGELYQVEPGHLGDITLRVRAVDTKDFVNPDVAGNYQELSVHFDNTIPRLENLSHGSGDYVEGNFTLTGDVLDDEQIATISISYDGGVSYTNITGNPTCVTQNTTKDYDLHVPIASTTYVPNSGILYLRLKVVDNANYQKIEYINLNVDNVYPTGAYTGASSDLHGSTVNARVQGTAEDSGSVSGIREVHVYFVRGTTVYNPRSSGSTTVGSNDFGDGSGSVPYTTNGTYKIVIDNRYELGDDLGSYGDGDGSDESLTLSGSTYNWWAEFNSAIIPDGVIDIHYVVFDNAGNGHHYVQSGFIKNNKPTITSVTVGSDLNMNNSVESPAETFPYSGPFSARNRLYIGISATDNNLPGLIFRVYHDPGGANTLVQSAATGTINIAGYSDGPTEFLCRVTDSDGIAVETTLQVTVANSDTVNPVIAINPLTQSDAVAGHIELDDESLYDGGDPDVSGTVTLRGTASDNQRIQEISVTIPSFDAGSGVGVEHVVASWTGSDPPLTSSDGAFVIDTWSLTEAGGHQITWTYTWNTSEVTNSVGRNIAVRFKVTDFASPTAGTDAEALGVDVVPYISSISTQTSGIKDGNIRAVSGKYSIRQSSSASDLITVTGFNLHPTNDVGVRVSSDPDGLSGTTLLGTPLTLESPAASPWTQLVLRKNSDRSGYLSLVAGTDGDPIPSINNLNDNTRTYNQEPDIYSKNYLLNDDRYLRFFSVTNTGYLNGYYPAMLMNGDTPLFAYCDDNNGDTRRNGTVIGQGWYHRMNALARDAAGTYYQVSVHDAFGGGGNGHLTLFYDTWGGSVYPLANPGSTGDGNNALALDNITFTNLKLNRYHYPRLEVRGDTTKAQVYLMYYDDEPSIRDLVLRVFQIGTTCDGTEVTNLAGAIDSNQDEATGDGTAGTVGAQDGRNQVVDSASQYFDMGLTSTGVLVVAYYDEAANRLKFTYNTAPVNGNGLYNTGGGFSAPLSMDTSYNGAHVSLAVDSADHIHIAYYDSANADLKYIYLDSYADTTPSVARVDAYTSVGLWTDIQVDASGVPVIGYFNNSENGTGDSIKLARFLGTLPAVTGGVDGLGNVTGNWECLTVPVIDAPRGGLPQFNRVNLGFDSSGDAVLGYLADDLEYSVELPEIL